jgi:formylglycine-generating enzyme required for sulfatase activity
VFEIITIPYNSVNKVFNADELNLYGIKSGSNRVKRDGSWYNHANNLQAGNMNNNNPYNENNNIGFRFVSTGA